MPRTNKHIRIFTNSLLLTIGLALTACGGGGGGGGGPTYPSITYTGNSNQATVSADNAKDFPVTMLEGSTSSSQSNPYGVVLDNNSTKDAQHAAMMTILAEQIKNDVANKLSSTDNNFVSGATQSVNGTCPTNPGSFSVSDDGTTETNINITFTYNNFCVGNLNSSGLETTLHGKITITGSYSGNPPIFETLSMSIDYMKVSVRNDSGTFNEELSGSMTVTFDGTSSNTVTGLTIATNFEVNSLVYKIENMVVDATGGTFTVSGRFYHPVHGYVDVTTTEPFDNYSSSTSPDQYCSGTLQISGSGGVIDFTADATCSTYEICFTPTGEAQSCTANIPWPQ